MTAAQYKKLCKEPNVFMRFILDGTLRLLNSDTDLQAKLRAILAQDPIPKPALHQEEHNEWTDHFRVDVSKAEADEIISALLSAEAGAVSESGETTPHATFIAHWVDSWTTYREYLGEAEEL